MSLIVIKCKENDARSPARAGLIDNHKFTSLP